ncbi:MAG: hypothetical protein FJY97_19760 [candidate division Zixibacteria bacterium]|nr:hypothetical protein [candidate division Zixibacteria bacterium]
MPVYLVSEIPVRDFGAETLRVGDLNSDGAPDLLFVQSVYETRAISCLTATTLSGEMLWQRGVPDPKNGRIYADLPVQVYDWNGNGRNEVLYIAQARYAERDPADGWAQQRALRYEGETVMHLLDASTGNLLQSFPLPAPADDSFLFADLKGKGRRQDFVVKDRYWNMWGISGEGSVLWQWQGSTGHFPAIADVDGDGCDEVFVGFALIDHDGTVLFSHDPGDGHQDASFIVRAPDGAWRLLFGNHGLHCLDVDGSERWFHPLAEAQHVIAGRFRDDAPAHVMAIDRGQRSGTDRLPSVLYLYDLEGREIWRRVQPAGSWAVAIVPIGWRGGALEDTLVYNRGPETHAAIYDGNGDTTDIFQMRYTSSLPGVEKQYYCTRADVWGDSRDEVIFFGSGGACVYANATPLALPTHYNNTLYPGM